MRTFLKTGGILFLGGVLAFSVAACSKARKDSGMELNKTAPAAQAKPASSAVYACPMHPEVTSDKPGKCPKCGMELVKKEAAPAAVYVCPMHPEVTSDKPGKCPKCGMELEKQEK